MNGYITRTFPNIGYIKTKLTEEEVAPIKKEIDWIKNNFNAAVPRNENLAGHINREYSLIDCKEHLNSLVLPYVMEHNYHFDTFKRYSSTEKVLPVELHAPWVNFQSKHEFNPIHKHNGVMSFVIWIKLPFKLEDELKRFPHISQSENVTSQFEFIFTDSLGAVRTENIPADHNDENTLLIFPSNMTHGVHPFYTSDDYRISVSGNFIFKV